MATPRDQPYVWVTWIARLMAGDAHCDWAAWFRAHHQYDRLPGDFDLASWTAQHGEMVRQSAASLRSQGYEVSIESQNAFKLTGGMGTILAGKPDILAASGDRVRVIDCKTGSPKTADHFQVLIYMLALPHCHRACKGKTIEGRLEYRAGPVEIPASKVTPEIRRLFRDAMHRVGGAAELPRVPSYDECRYCDISAADCPERIEAPPAEEPVADHDLY